MQTTGAGACSFSFLATHRGLLTHILHGGKHARANAPLPHSTHTHLLQGKHPPTPPLFHSSSPTAPPIVPAATQSSYSLPLLLDFQAELMA